MTRYRSVPFGSFDKEPTRRNTAKPPGAAELPPPAHEDRTSLARKAEGRRPRTLGVLGGMGPLATQIFFGTLIQATDAASDQDHIRVIIDSNPTIPDRSAFLAGQGPDPRPSLRLGAERLSRAGADLLVMPCNTANIWAEEIAQHCGIPIVNWLEVAADYASDAGESPIGILATSGTIRSGVYQNLLAARGQTVVLPSAEHEANTMAAIYGPHGVKATGGRTPAGHSAILNAIHGMALSGARSVLLGCTELVALVSPADPGLGVRILEPSQAVARIIIRTLGGRVRDP